MKTLCLLVTMLVLSAPRVVPCWSADLQRTGSQQVKQAAPQVPAVRPERKPSPPLTSETQVKMPVQIKSLEGMTSPVPSSVRVDKGRVGPARSSFGEPGKPVIVGKPNYNTAILSKISLSSWQQTKTQFVGLAGQVKFSPKKMRVISKVTQRLNEIDGLMQRVAELQESPQENKPAWIKISIELQKYERIIKGLKLELETPLPKPDKTGEDAQLANIELQNMLQKQQQMIQMMAQVSKLLHDTAMAVIRKIG